MQRIVVFGENLASSSHLEVAPKPLMRGVRSMPKQAEIKMAENQAGCVLSNLDMMVYPFY